MREGSGGRKVDVELRRSRRTWAEAVKWRNKEKPSK